MKALIIAILTLVSFNSYADGERGNGGLAVQADGGLYTFDLYQASLHTVVESVKFDDIMGAEAKISVALPSISPITAKYTAFKLNQINVFSSTLAKRLLDLIKIYGWQIAPRQLIPIMDIGNTPILLDGLKFARVGYRDDEQKQVWFAKESWIQLDARNQSAMLFHELFYSIAAILNGDTTSEKTRNAIALLFSPSFSIKSGNEVLYKFQKYLGLLSIEKNEMLDCLEIQNKVDSILSAISYYYSPYWASYSCGASRPGCEIRELIPAYEQVKKLMASDPIGVCLSHEKLMSVITLFKSAMNNFSTH